MRATHLGGYESASRTIAERLQRGQGLGIHNRRVPQRDKGLGFTDLSYHFGEFVGVTLSLFREPEGVVQSP